MRLKATALALVLVLAGTASATAITCRSRPNFGDGNHWMWRDVDSRRCWYPGRRMVSKSILHWSSRERAEPRRTRSKRVRHERYVERRMVQDLPMPREVEMVEVVAWPPPPVLNLFEQRFMRHWPAPAPIVVITPFERRFLGQ